ncbi:methyltransferase-like protein 7B [Pollicipes pollicipes]|uniref:methyltransferase-like protein 7B n=1 Tax=Pollicipes pollicipes TaxID=41117 RepID=UPI001885332E|nr:methyltransferase-like protein 7B [Pollicipes pollicipes]
MLPSVLGWTACLLGWAACLLNWTACLLGWLLLLVMTLRVALGPDGVDALRARLMAWAMNRFKTQQEQQLAAIKAELFEEMKQMQSAGPNLKGGSLDILEIGVGCGTNLQHYPAGSVLTCVDPNIHFQDYFRRTCVEHAAHLHPDIRFVVGHGEDMTAVKDGSVDAVVLTLVLCSVRDPSKVVHEVQRVLRPGGKFIYLEHIGFPENTFQRRIQDALTHSGVWPCVMQCWLNRDPRKVIEAGHFRSVEQRLQPIVEHLSLCSPLHLMNRCLTGVATK